MSHKKKIARRISSYSGTLEGAGSIDRELGRGARLLCELFKQQLVSHAFIGGYSGFPIQEQFGRIKKLV